MRYEFLINIATFLLYITIELKLTHVQTFVVIFPAEEKTFSFLYNFQNDSVAGPNSHESVSCAIFPGV